STVFHHLPPFPTRRSSDLRLLQLATPKAVPPPELGKRLLDAWLVAVSGTVTWLVAFVVLLVLGAGDVWIYTGLSGVVVGLLGMGLMYWQQSASRRGTRGAQRGL